MLEISAAVLIAAALIMVAGFTSLLAFRFGAPLLLVFLLLGLLVGEDGLGIHFDDASLAFFIGSLALAVILFDSGFGTKLSSLKAAATPAIVLATLGVLLTTGLVGAAAHFTFGFPWLEAFLVGAVISSTDAAAVFFLLRVGGITIQQRVRTTLEIESGSNDPMAIFLTITLVELILANNQQSALSHFLMSFVQQMGLGLILGGAGGYLIVRMANAVELEPGLYPIVVLAAALAVFGATGALGGSGFLAAYVAGIFAGNSPITAKVTLLRFQAGFTWLAQISMFLVLGLLATPSQFPAIALQAVGLALFLTFVGRPLAVWLCLLPFNYRPNETAFIAWVGLRGAVSILLAIMPLAAGLPNGQIYFDVAFIMVLTSLLLQGWTIRPMARRLGLVVPPRLGAVERLELDLPGTAHHELVVYRVAPDSPVARGERIPRWARPSLVIRDGRSMRYQYAGKLRPGDQLYLFAAPRFLRLLDRLFASPAPLDSSDTDFFGAFTVTPERSLRELRDVYEVPVDDQDADRSIADYILKRVGGHADIGDRVALGDIELIVRDVDEAGAIKSVGLSIEPRPARSAILPLFLNVHELLDWIRGRWSKYTQ
jgi:cell volume regulation protein A